MNTKSQAPPGKIVTFYSYKGGTGRTMALANVAWILAYNGKRVLVVDWDVEAPGLHRYFRPFLPDPELSETPGLIDFFVKFWEATRIPPTSQSNPTASERPWYSEYADLLGYVVPLDYEFPNHGALHFVGAGRQGASYGSRVNRFRWDEFYEELGGGIFLEHVKEILKAEYDYILIDSRTGLSDTSGICTVQMPDELVVCFTMNRQSMEGAAATARSADLQKRLADDRPGLKIWPVPMRVELAEKERLQSAQEFAKVYFSQLLWHLPPAERSKYLTEMEVLYFPYYAYEEILATIADPPGQQHSLLGAVERLASRLHGAPITMPKLPAGGRELIMARYGSEAKSQVPSSSKIFVGSVFQFDESSLRAVSQLAEALEQVFGAGHIFWDEKILPGESVLPAIKKAIRSADWVLLVCATADDELFEFSQESDALREARRLKKRIVPVLTESGTIQSLPLPLQKVRSLRVGKGPEGVEKWIDQVRPLLAPDGNNHSSRTTIPVDPDDPNNGQFGESSRANGRILSATVLPDTDGWFSIDLMVTGTSPSPLLEGYVEFHLHPTFRARIKTVKAVNGVASLRLSAWGAFTVGAVTDDGATRLELDLASLSDAPTEFTSR